MFLRKVTLTGFKSFAAKTVLDLEPEITGIVGPNGSGKSNLADAIRWALGEQGKNRLRLGDANEVIFAGTTKLPRASFAEVILLFDNEDGAFALDLTEVEISRRLYRSGESDYRIAGRTARLADIQALLASAGVGASSYAVIGQGMIDTILTSSPAERKILFDEAAGIRSSELGREAALRKLTATANNLTRLRDISAELSPRLKQLESKVGASNQRNTLQNQIADLKKAILYAEYREHTLSLEAAKNELRQLHIAFHTLRHKTSMLQCQWRIVNQAQIEAEQLRIDFQQRLSSIELRRDKAAMDLTTARAANVEATRQAHLRSELTKQLQHSQSELKVAKERMLELTSEQHTTLEAAARAQRAVDAAGRDVSVAQENLVALRDGVGDGARDQYVDHALHILKLLIMGIGTPEYSDDQVRILVHKVGRLLSHASSNGAAEILTEVKSAQKKLEAAMKKRDTAVEHQTNITITTRSLEIDISHQQADITRAAELVQKYELGLKPFEDNLQEVSATSKACKVAETQLNLLVQELDEERAQLAELSASRYKLTSSVRLLTDLEQSKRDQFELITRHTDVKNNLKKAMLALKDNKYLTDNTDSEFSSKYLAISSKNLTDQLARTETLLEIHLQADEEQNQEYQQASERNSQLNLQISDLERAESDLHELISDLDKMIRFRFKENFQALAEQFSSYFGKLFEGGKASLELVDESESGYGIQIKASPNGKRLQSLTALSGGERALAGVALVAAIMRVNPSPFVVLDEIDAALDESNSGRLAGILVEIKQAAQLIVITHNRQTMTAANVLFGVTINHNHVSRLISMRLEQATQLAAR